MEEAHYYKGVLQNLGRLGIRMLCFCLLSLFVLCARFILLRGNASDFLTDLLSIILFALFIYIALSVIYLFYSYLERIGYESERAISRASLLPLFLTVIAYGVNIGVTAWLNTLTIRQAELAERLMIVDSLSGGVISLTLLMFLSCFGYEYTKAQPNRGITRACTFILLTFEIGTVLSSLVTGVRNLLLPRYAEVAEFHFLLSDVMNLLNGAVDVAYTVGVSVLLIALVRDRRIGKGHLLAPFVFAVLWGVEGFLYTQIDFTQVYLYHSVGICEVLVYFCAILDSVGRREDRLPKN